MRKIINEKQWVNVAVLLRRKLGADEGEATFHTYRGIYQALEKVEKIRLASDAKGDPLTVRQIEYDLDVWLKKLIDI